MAILLAVFLKMVAPEVPKLFYSYILHLPQNQDGRNSFYFTTGILYFPSSGIFSFPQFIHSSTLASILPAVFFLLLIFVSLFFSQGFRKRLSSCSNLPDPLFDPYRLLLNASGILLLEYSCQGGIVTFDLHLMSRLRISGAKLPLLLYVLISGTREPLAH